MQEKIKHTAEKLLKYIIQSGVQAEPWPEQALVLPRMQAHRGYWLGGAQENTLQSFREARAQGALMIECDVRLSKDQIPVVVHDDNLQRIAGVNKKVSELTASELSELARVPSLYQVLVDPSVPRLVNVEFKSNIIIDDALERKSSEVVKKANAFDRVLFSSFNPFSLYRVGLYLPDVPRALLVSEENHPENHFLLKTMSLAPFFSFHLLHLNHQMVDENSMKFWRQKRIPVAVWTVNGRDEIQKYLRMGAISIITDSL